MRILAVKVLSREIYELIAAGEVVSRPKYVVKELVENSIDAGAKSISVEIKNGGKSLIRVVDDGIGMSFDDCKLAFLRHATSKISNESDLDSIKTLGFRGEALASICAVSKVEVLTKLKGSGIGTRYVNYGGVEKTCEKVDCSEGLNFKVEQLFYNVPARSKFLKTDLTEANLIQEILEKLAVSHVEIAFDFKKNGRKIFQTLGNGSLSDAIYSIYGKDVVKNLMSVSNVFGNVEVSGFVSKPVFCKARGNLNLGFVNSRYVKSKIFNNAVDQAFKGFVMIGRKPSYILFLKMPFSDVDINVHPAKTQVQFAKENEIFKAIYLAVKKSIERNNDVFEQSQGSFSFNVNDCKNENYFEKRNNLNSEEIFIFDDKDDKKSFVECGILSEVKDYKISAKKNNSDVNFDNCDNLNYVLNSAENRIENIIKKSVEDELVVNDELNDSLKVYDVISGNSNKSTSENSEVLKSEGVYELRLIGEVFKTYILAEYRNKFIVIDKHAAHERVIYESLKKDLNNFEQQQLLKPIKVSVNSVVDCNLILKNLNVFSYFGFELEPFGQHNLLLRSVPAFLSEKNCLDVFYEVVENLKLNKFDLTPSTIENILHSMACKSAVKANDLNSNEQLFELVKQVYYNSNIRTCPHGRPVILVFDKDKFDSEFKRT